MAASGSSFIPTPLAHADNQGEGPPRGAPLQSEQLVLHFSDLRNGKCALSSRFRRHHLSRYQDWVQNGGVATAVSALSMIRGPQATGDPKCVNKISRNVKRPQKRTFKEF
ncbi:hypothetical protein TNCV_1899161 [Trichonephila clavipes]|nr:hypothetical protein TNCV_1899161 [Trichonephila clavipes]